MKNIVISLILTALLLPFSLYAQQNSPVSTLQSVTSTTNTASVDILASDFIGIVSGDIKITFNPAIASIVSVTTSPLLGGFTNINLMSPGEVKIGWFSSQNPITVGSGTAIFTLNFNKVSNGTSSLNFIDTTALSTECQFYNNNGLLNDLPTSAYWINGSLTFMDAGSAPITSLPNLSSCPGTSLEVPVTVKNFIDIGGVNLKLLFDHTVLTFNTVLNTAGFPILTFGNTTPGELIIGGFSSAGIDIPDNDTFVTIQFAYHGGSTSLQWLDDGTSCEYADGNFVVLTDSPQSSFYINGSVQCTSEPPSGTPPSGTTGINACYIDANTLPTGVPAFNYSRAANAFTDSCGMPVESVIITDTVITGDDCAWQATYVYKVVDSCGNELTNQLLTYAGGDNTKPVLATAAISGDLGCNPTVLAPGFTGTDNCEGSITPVVTTAGPSNIGCAYSQTWYANYSDACGNAADELSITYTWTVDVAPVFSSCPSASIDLGCNPTSLPDATMAISDAGTATDDCGATPGYSAVSNGAATNTGCVWSQSWTVTATGGCGLTATCVVTYTWTVDAAPVFVSCPSSTIDLGCNPAALPDAAMAIADAGTATDDCGATPGYSAVSNGAATNTGCVWSQSWTVTATGGCGGTATCVLTFTWTVDAAPVFVSCPSSTFDLGCNPSALPDAAMAIADAGTATDDCGATPGYSAVSNGAATNTGCVWTQNWTVTATGGCGGTANCVVTYTWTVDAAPEFTSCPSANIDLGCNPISLPDAAMAISDAGTVTDDCGATPSYSALSNGAATNIGCVWSQSWTVTATGGCGLTATCVLTYTWTVDATPVFVSCPSSTFDLGCNPSSLPDAAMAISDAGTATDDCGATPGYSAVSNGVATNTGCVWSQSWTVTATGGCGGTANCVVTYTWTEDAAPVFVSCPSSTIDLGCNPAALPDAAMAIADAGTATDDCGATPGYSAVSNGAASNTGCVWSQSWTVTATGGCGLTATCVVTYTWTEDTAPVFVSCPSSTFDLGCNPSSLPDAAMAISDAGTATDDCGVTPGYSAVSNGAATNTGCVWSQSWTVTATGGCGLTATCILNYSWKEDNTDPVVICPPAQDFCSNTGGTYTIPAVSATDNCGETLTYSYAISGATTRSGSGTNASGSFSIGISTIAWTITDQCNNTASCQTVVTITETPVLSLVSALCDPSLTTYDVSFTNTVGSISTTAGTVSGNNILNIPVGIDITITSTNGSCTATLGVSSPNCNCPNIAAPQNPNNPAVCENEIIPALSVDAPATGYQINWYADQSGGTALASASHSYTPSVIAPGIHTYYAENEEIISGCKSNRIPVTLTINALPTITCPTDYTATDCNLALPAGANDLSAFLALGGSTNATGISYSDGTPSLVACAETTIRTYTATQNGCTATCTQTMVRTVDTEDPVFAACPGSAVNLGCNPASLPDALMAMSNAGNVSDNCGIDDISAVGASILNVGCSYSQVWTVTATDGCGNTAQCLLTYTWTVATAPVIANLPSGGALGCNPTTLPSCDANVTASNECGAVTVSCTPGTIAVNGCDRAQTFTYSATECGLTTSSDVTYTWTEDNTDPVATCPTFQDFCSNATGTYNIPSVTAIDNCGGTLTYSYDITGATTRSGSGTNASGVFNIGISTIEWTITDECHNTASCQTVVTITETPELGLVSTLCDPSLTSYDVNFTNTVGSISTTAGTVSGNSIIDIPVGTDITITSTNGNCIATLGVNSPNCVCPSIPAPQNPNNPVICENEIIPALSVDAPATGYEINWYADQSGGTALASATHTFTPSVNAPGNHTYYAENEDIALGCPSNRIPVSLTINALPTISCPPYFVASTCNTDIPAGATNPSAFIALGGSTDATGISYSDGTPSLSGCTETTIRTYTATLNGCTSTCTQALVRIIDTDKPILSTASTNGDLGCNPTVKAPKFSGTDNCQGIITPVVTTAGPSNIGCDYTQTWTANYTDGCGNSADPISITFTWTVDTEKPVLATSGTNGDLGCNPSVLAPSFTGTDNCEGSIIPVVTTLGPNNNGCAYTQTWIASYTDNCSNVADPLSITYTWTQDNTDPVAICPPAQNFCSNAAGTYTILPVTATDNCGGTLTYSYAISGATTRNGSGIDASGTFNTGISTIAWTITDECNNTASCQTVVTITETPVLNFVSATCDPSLTTYDVIFTNTGGTISATAGTVSGNSILNIPVGTDITITSTNGACVSTLGVSAPNCACPGVLPPQNPNSPVICEGEPTPALTVLTATAGFQINWYASQTGGTALASATHSYIPSENAPGTYTYYVENEEIISGCKSNRIPVTLTINALPPITCPTDLYLCADASPVQLSGASPIGGTYTGPGITSGTFYPEVAGAGDHTVGYTYQLGMCANTCTFTIHTGPVAEAGPDSNITVCAPFQFQGIASGVGPLSINWTPAVYLDDPSAANPYFLGGPGGWFVLEVTDGNGCLSRDSVFILPSSDSAAFSGRVAYDNIPGSGLPGFCLILTNLWTQEKDTLYTNPGGFFCIDPLKAAPYAVSGHYAIPWPWGGVNATDALAVLRHFVGLMPLQGLKLKAGDVNQEQGANATDALQIAQRFAGIIDTFNAPDWIMEPDTLDFSQGGLLFGDYLVLAMGDANGSYVPGLKQGTKGKTNTSSQIQSGPEGAVRIPITLSEPLLAGAISIKIPIPAGLTLKKVYTAEGMEGSLQYNTQDQHLSISWFTPSGLWLSPDVPWIYLEGKISVNTPYCRFTDPAYLEIAGIDTKIVEGIGLKIPEIIASGEEIRVHCYPNPFKDETTLQYSLKDAGSVVLEVFDLTGSLILNEAADHDAAGTYKFRINSKHLRPGSYFYRLRMNGNQDLMEFKGKLIKH